MRIGDWARAIGTAAVAASVSGFAQSEEPVPAEQSIFAQLGADGTLAYFEIISENDPVPPDGGISASAFTAVIQEPESIVGSTIPCISGFSHANCSAEYEGFRATDISGGATHIPGWVDLEGSPYSTSGMWAQAAVWVPGAGGVVLLDDASQTQALLYGTEEPSATQHASFAFDISDNSMKIVGLAEGYYAGGGEGFYELHWLLPLMWMQDGPNSWGTGQVLPLPSGGGLYDAYGGALGISGDGMQIAGFTGGFDCPYGGYCPPMPPQATHWSWQDDSWTVTPLGTLDEDQASVANDVNGMQQVVGWSGELGGLQEPREEVLNTVLFSPSWWAVLGDWNPAPFVWTPDFESLQQLSLGEDYYVGEARAISEGGNVAVGWVSQGDLENGDENESEIVQLQSLTPPDQLDDTPVQAAAWINNPLDGVQWAGNTLLPLGTPTPTGDEVALFGSVANAVDGSGTVIVGDVLFDVTMSGASSRAAFWQLDENFNLVGGGILQDELAAAGVPLEGAELTLTRATGVRTVFNEDGTPGQIYVTGEGQGSFGSWLASLTTPGGPPPGLTTPASLGQTLTLPGTGARDIAHGIGYIARNQSCKRPDGLTVEEAPWCFFGFGTGSIYDDAGSNGLTAGKQLGIAHFFDEDTSIGASFGLDWTQGQIAGGSNYSALAAVAGLYGAHEPDEGMRAKASLALGHLMNATFNRVYVNGVATATSTGATDGWGYGFRGELAYGYALDEKTRVVPFVSLDHSGVSLAGWSDAGGPFNATFSGFTTTRTALTVGVGVEHELADDLEFYGSVELSAAHLGGTAPTVAVAGTNVTPAMPAGWGTMLGATAGLRKDLDESTNIFGQVSASTNLSGGFGAAIAGGFNKSF